jgi:hypothetical protein
VHALRHVHQLLVPDGTLVDMHPVTEEHVAGPAGPVGVIPEPRWVTVELPNAETALQTVIGEGLFELEAETAYEVLHHFTAAEELLEARRDLLEEQEVLVRAIRTAGTPLVTSVRVVFRRLRVGRLRAEPLAS